MNKANLKIYAPKARLDFIAAVTARAHLLGISAIGASPAVVLGDVAIIEGREWTAKVSAQRDALIARIKLRGFEQTLDEVAYTWFNRFAALRFMEIHEYLDHGWRVLSSRDGGLPEILRHASEVSLPGLNAGRAREMQLAGNQDDELYKLLLVAQCNELSRSMPFLFERIDDDTELLLPENLLRTDSIVAKLVKSVPEEDWQQIEVIGWLYQFYISEKKDDVIGRVVKSEDIPAATQLFTPSWIAQYLVQNSVGQLWLMANPGSSLASHWLYYIKPAAQTSEVQAQIDSLIRTRIREDGEALNPETITVLDPACGSGHLLVVAYDVLKAAYLERGYQPRVVPRLILEKNLYGLDIDERAAQLAAFALLMKARADDRRLLNDPPNLNVIGMQESQGFNLSDVLSHLTSFGIQQAPLKTLLDLFDKAKSFGSLIRVPSGLNQHLAEMTAQLQQASLNGDLYAQNTARGVMRLVRQAQVLGMQFDVVVANPPYMGRKYYSPEVKSFTDSHYKSSKGDLYTCFMARNAEWARFGGSVAMITIPNWMFSSGFEEFRGELLAKQTIESLCHNGRGVFGSDFGSCAFSIRVGYMERYSASYKRLFDRQGSVASNDELMARFLASRTFLVSAHDLKRIPGYPIAYWSSETIRAAFQRGQPLDTVAKPLVGLQTGDNERFIRRWTEVSVEQIAFNTKQYDSVARQSLKWVPYTKGGDFCKWYGNQELVVDWSNDGEEITSHPGAYPRNKSKYFHEGISYTNISSSRFAARYTSKGFIFDQKGSMFFASTHESLMFALGLLHSSVAPYFLGILCPTVDFNPGDLSRIPVIGLESNLQAVSEAVESLVRQAKESWDSLETSWDYSRHPLLSFADEGATLAGAFEKYVAQCERRLTETTALEVRNNTLFIHAYGLDAELSPAVTEDQITLVRADRDRDSRRLISHAIGCMMGRYSLDEPGLIYAHAGNLEFDATRYIRFPADSDGIVPLTDERWFEDDAAGRVREFLCAAWGGETLEVNMAWLAESLGVKGSETPEEAIRRYLFERFFKDHLQSYKRRPIYWLFSSGKLGAFQAVVYLHRYHEGMLARLRAEYVVPLIAKLIARLEMLEKDAGVASSTAGRAKIQKQIDSLRKKQIELLAYDEKLRHYADMRIELDLDDGVRVNYGKFGDLVAEAKLVVGNSDE